jgi:peptidoglycan hydrolase CwlO-like protein
MHDDNKGFPVAPTAENLAAALKRAADAEDNLRAEVRSNQALVAEYKTAVDAHQALASEVAKLRTAAAGDQAYDEITDNERWRIAAAVRAFIQGSAPPDIESFLYIVADRIEEDSLGEYGSKSTIADLREQLQARDQAIAAYRSERAEVIAELAAVQASEEALREQLKARDQTIADLCKENERAWECVRVADERD